MGNALFDPKTMGNFRKALLNGFTFNAGLAAKLPMAFISGCRITELNEEQCKVTIPYRWLNNNPFGTTYWAVLGMAAETTTKGYDENGVVVNEWKFTWGIKARK